MKMTANPVKTAEVYKAAVVKKVLGIRNCRREFIKKL